MAKIGCKVVDAFEQQKFCDVSLLLADGSKIGAHRTVLQIGSQWFQTRLSKEWDHAEDQHPVNFTDFSVHITNGKYKEMLQASDFYYMPELYS